MPTILLLSMTGKALTLELSKENLSVKVKQGETTKETITITNKGNETIEVKTSFKKAEELLEKATKVLKLKSPPKEAQNCEYCRYRNGG